MSHKLDFAARVAAADPAALRAARIETVMLNVGLRCDLACSHCHHSCSPRSTESMSSEVLKDALALATAVGARTLDLTGGSPELWPLLGDAVAQARERGLDVRVRTNLVALGADPSLPAFLAEHGVALIASLPDVTPAAVDSQRGRRTYERSIARLRELASMGWGDGTADGGPLVLDLAVNPALGELPCDEAALRTRFTKALGPLGINFRRVLALPNVPIGRLERALRRAGRSDAYLHRLADRFNPSTLDSLFCRHTLEVAWDGRLFDCDYNLAALLAPAAGPIHVCDALRDPTALYDRRIAFASHCFACTADAGSG